MTKCTKYQKSPNNRDEKLDKEFEQVYLPAKLRKEQHRGTAGPTGGARDMKLNRKRQQYSR